MSLDNNHHDVEAEEDPRSITILYATETGNAQDVAEQLARLCRRLHFAVHVSSLEDYSAVYELPVDYFCPSSHLLSN